MRISNLLLVLGLGGLLVVAPAWSAEPAKGVKPGAGWGAPSAPAAKASEAGEEDDGRANGDYFHDFGELMMRVRSVRWISDYCSDAFPADAELQRRAYADWLQAHRAFVDEMEGQFGLIEKHWSGAASGAHAGLSADALRAKLESARAVVQDSIRDLPLSLQKARCEAFPQALLSRRMDLEKSEPDLVKSVRAGPR